MKAAYPSGSAIAIPVPINALPPLGCRTVCSAAIRSHPASPCLAYFGSGKVGSSRLMGTFSTLEA